MNHPTKRNTFNLDSQSGISADWFHVETVNKSTAQTGLNKMIQTQNVVFFNTMWTFLVGMTIVQHKIELSQADGRHFLSSKLT